MKQIRVQTVVCGTAVLGSHAYDIKHGDTVVAFYVDAWGKTGRAWPISTSSAVGINGELVNIPSIVFESGDDNTDEVLTEVCFPDFPGWDVHSCSGGKTVAVCLTLSR